MKYRFENFSIELVELNDPTIVKVGNDGFAIGDETVRVWADISTSETSIKRVYLGEMENFDGWNDDDLQAFAVTQLETFKVVE